MTFSSHSTIRRRASRSSRVTTNSSRMLPVWNGGVGGTPEMKGCLSPLEQALLDAAELGDKHTVIRCLQDSAGVNVNVTNMSGQTALQIAVDYENIELVEVLLQHPHIKVGCALLYAIQEGVYRLVEMLIDHKSITPEMLGTNWKTCGASSSGSGGGVGGDGSRGSGGSGCGSSTGVGAHKRGDTEMDLHHFSTDISPVILAATCNQFEILQLLISRGATIEKPHPLSCVCSRCKEQVSRTTSELRVPNDTIEL